MSRASDSAPGPLPDWLSRAGDDWFVVLRAQPGARRFEAAGVVDGRLKLKVAAPPVEGKANEALQRWVATVLEVRIRDVELVSGQTGRNKRLRIRCDLPEAEIVRRLLGEAPGS